jgi:hypothetical protein
MVRRARVTKIQALVLRGPSYLSLARCTLDTLRTGLSTAAHCSPWGALVISDPGIEHPIQKIDKEIDDHKDQGRDQHHPLYDRIIARV